eukprot:7900193-Prorocentrum_lima.AAC.1
MEVSANNMWVVSPPCPGLSKLARKVRYNSARKGVGIDGPRADQHQLITTQIQMAWAAHQTIQQDQRHRP